MALFYQRISLVRETLQSQLREYSISLNIWIKSYPLSGKMLTEHHAATSMSDILSVVTVI